MEKEGRKQRKPRTVEELDVRIGALAEKRKKLQLARHIALGRLVEKCAKGGFEGFDQTDFISKVNSIMKGVDK